MCSQRRIHRLFIIAHALFSFPNESGMSHFVNEENFTFILHTFSICFHSRFNFFQKHFRDLKRKKPKFAFLRRYSVRILRIHRRLCRNI